MSRPGFQPRPMYFVSWILTDGVLLMMECRMVVSIIGGGLWEVDFDLWIVNCGWLILDAGLRGVDEGLWMVGYV